MANPLLGLHLPNRPLEPGELDRILATGCRDVVDLDLFADRWPELARRGLRIHARCYVRGDLADAAAESAVLADLVRQHGASVATWRWRNEPNVESPGLTPRKWREFLVAFGRRVRELVPSVRLYAPAVSPGTRDWLDWLEATKLAIGPGRYDGLDGHTYGDAPEVGNQVAILRAEYDGPILVTEYNPGAGRQFAIQQWADDLSRVAKIAADYVVDAICLFIWHWNAPDMALPTPVDVRGTPVEAALARVNQEARVVAIPDYWSPNRGDRRSSTLGVVIHSTRGATGDLETEYQATVRWLNNPASQASAHAVVGPSAVHRPVRPELVAWHAKEHSATHLGIEIVQPRRGDSIPDAVIRRAARVVAEWCVLYKLPIRWDVTRGLAEHREMPQGKRDGKSDIGPPFDRAAFLELVKAEARALAPKPRLAWGELAVYRDWHGARAGNLEDPRDVPAFRRHLVALGCADDPYRYGCPAKA